MSKLRWCLVIPVSIASWYLALVVALIVLGVVESMCPPDLMVSGLCHAPWYEMAFDVVVVFGAALSAIFVVLSAAYTAPRNRVLIAKIAFAMGCLAATHFVYETALWSAYIAAISAGAITVYTLYKRYVSHIS